MTDKLPSEIYLEVCQSYMCKPEKIWINAFKEAERALIERAEKAEKQLEALNERTRWIPISEELPNPYEDVLIFNPTG